MQQQVKSAKLKEAQAKIKESKIKLAKTLTDVKSAQESFKGVHTKAKSAMTDPTMGAPDKEDVVEQVLQQAEVLVETMVSGLDAVSGDMEEIGEEEFVEEGMGDDHGGEGDMNEFTKMYEGKLAKQAQEFKDYKEEQKEKEAKTKQAQEYVTYFPHAVREAKKEEFIKFAQTESSQVLQARIDTIKNITGKEGGLVKFAKDEDSPFNFDNVDDDSNRLDMGSKI